MTLEQATRLKENDDFKAFLELLKEDVESIKEDMVNQAISQELFKTQIRLQTIRMVAGRLDHVIEELSPESPASDPDARIASA